jgi:hypothetical protein
MAIRQIAKGTGKALWTILALPWRAMRMNLQYMRKAKEAHRDNVVMIRDLYRDATRKNRREANLLEPVEQSFDDAMNNRGPDAPSIEQLERRFILQKRLALWAGLAFLLLGLVALAKGNLLGIATLLTCIPLFFMAALAAQLRLWQLRTRRLSRKEKGGLTDFIREIDGWYWDVLNPEYGKKIGEET